MENNYKNQKYILAYNQLLKECDAVYHAAAMRAGLSDCAFWILYTLQNATHSYTQSEICDDGFMPRQTVNSALKKLEKDGYLTLHPRDGRMGKDIRLTAKGASFVQKHIAPVVAAEDAACGQFSDVEKNQFLTTFRTLVDHLKKEIELALPEEI